MGMSKNKAERGFGLLAQTVKPSEKSVVQCSGHPFQY